MKVLSLVISIMFAAANITFATPKDYSTLRQPSTAISANAQAISSAIIDNTQTTDITSTIPSLEETLAEIPPASESAIKMVIFDWGKVINPYDYHIAARLLAERFGVDEELAFKFFQERNTNPENPVYQYEHGQIDGKQLTDATREWLRKNTKLEKIRLTVKEFEEIFVSIWGKSFPAVVSLITILREKGYKVCVLSTTNDIHYRYFMENVFPLLGIEKDDVFASHITGLAKPDIESYLQVIKQAGIEPEQALFVDDRRDCIEGAIRAGLQVRLFDPDDIEGSVKDIVGATLEGCLLQKAFDEMIPPASESSIKVVIFDQGNVVTLYDYEKVAEELHRRFGIDKKIGLDFCEERHSNPENPIYKYEHRKIDEEQLVAEVKQWLEDTLHRQVNLTKGDWREIFNKNWVGNIPEIVALIKDLKAKGYQIRGLATISRIHFEYVSDPANKIGLISLLEKPKHFYASCEREFAKPDKRSYLEVAKDTGVSPAQCLFVDDMPINIDGAKDAGLQVFLFAPLNPLQNIVDIASYLAFTRTTARSSSAGVSTGADEGTWRIAEAINKKIISPYATARGVIHKDRKKLADFDRLNDLVFTIVRAARAHFRNLTEFIKVDDILDYIEKATVWEGKGSESIVSIKEDELDYDQAQSMIYDLAGMYKTVEEAKAYLKGSALDRDDTYEITMATLNRFSPDTLMETVWRSVEENRIDNSAFLCGLPIPKVETEAQYFTELEQRFELSRKDMQKIKEKFAGHISKALAGVPDYFNIYKGYIGTPTGGEKGRYLSLEVGGSNIYLSMVELNANRKYEIFRHQPKFPIAENMKRGKGEAYFDYIAACIEDFLKEYEKTRGPGDGYKLGFIFSFALQKTGIDKAIVVETSKEYDLEGVIGQDPVDMLKDALNRRNIRNIEISSIGNDTESLEAGADYIYENCTESLVLGTGYNISVLTKGDIFNTEAGNWNDEYFSRRRTVFDEDIDAISLNRGSYLVEKILSGQYLGEIARRILYDMITRGLLFKGKAAPVFSNPWQFDAKYMDRFEAGTYFKGFLEDLVKERVKNEDYGIVRRVCDIVTTRAAKAVAIALAAAIENTDPNLKRSHNILVEGALFEFHPTLKYKIKEALREIFGKKAPEIEMMLNRDATKVGAAVMAAMAEKAKSSSAGKADRPFSEPFKISFEPGQLVEEPELKYFAISVADLREGIRKAFYQGPMLVDTLKGLLDKPDFHRDDILEVKVKFLKMERTISRVYLVTVRHKYGKSSFILDVDCCPSIDAQIEAQISGKSLPKTYAVPPTTHKMLDYLRQAYQVDSRFLAKPFAKGEAKIRVKTPEDRVKEVRITMTAKENLEGWDGAYILPIKSPISPGIIRSWDRLWHAGGEDYLSFAQKIVKILVVYYLKLNHKTISIIFTNADIMVYHPDIKKCDTTSPDDFLAAIGGKKRTRLTDIDKNMKVASVYELIPMERNEFIRALLGHKERTFTFGERNIFTKKIIIAGIKDALNDVYGPKKGKEEVKDWIAEVESTAKTADDKDIKQKTNLVYTLSEVLTVKNKKLRIVPLTPGLMIKKADEFFILQNSVAADAVWTKERDVIGVAKGRKDGPIQFDPELKCSFAVLDENDAPVAAAMYSSADERKGYAYLETFAVLPEYQGTAVASWILLHSFQEARRQGLTHASWITREELDETEKAHPYQRHSARAIPYYEIKVNARRDEKKGENGRIPPKEETGDDNVPWEVRPGKWHIAYHKDLSDLYLLYADFKTKSALCTISNRAIIVIDTAA